VHGQNGGSNGSTNGNNGYTALQQQLIQHHQQQVQQQHLILKKQSSLGPPTVNGSSRKHLSHSISEENDEVIDSDSQDLANNNANGNKTLYYGSLSKSNLNKTSNPNSINYDEKVTFKHERIGKNSSLLFSSKTSNKKQRTCFRRRQLEVLANKVKI
jgi:hypothetical protein